MKKHIGLGLALLLACDTGPDNFGPEACSDLETKVLEVGEENTQLVCFEDPEGDLLELNAASSSDLVATAQMLGTLVSVTAVGAGEALITVSATDPDGETAESSFMVMVVAPAQPEILLKDDFETLVSSWQLEYMTDSGIEEGRLWMTNDNKDTIAAFWHDVGPAESPIVRARVENGTDDMWATVLIETTDARFKAMAFVLGADVSRMSEDPSVPRSNYLAMFWDTNGPLGDGWYLLGHGMTDAIPAAGASMEAEIEITDQEVFIRVAGREIARASVDDLLPHTIQRVGLGATWPEDTVPYTEARVYFDWVEVTATLIS